MLKIYACGGTGINIAKTINNESIEVAYIDTSRSNLSGVKDKNIFIIEGSDGSGKNRALTYENFKDVVENVLIKHKPSEELNIIIMSLSGGTGSVVGPMLASQLSRNNKNVLCLTVASTSSIKEISNNIKTLQTFISLANTNKRCMTILIEENSENEGRHRTDKNIALAVELFSVMIDKTKTQEFDTSDLSNFINFDRVTDVEPCATIMSINSTENLKLSDNEHIVSTIHIVTDKNKQIKNNKPEYLALCVVTDSENKNEYDIRIDNIIGNLENYITQYEQIIENFKDEKKVKNIKLSKVTNANNDGIVI